jgi:hypothetical protein
MSKDGLEEEQKNGQNERNAEIFCNAKIKCISSTCAVLNWQSNDMDPFVRTFLFVSEIPFRKLPLPLPSSSHHRCTTALSMILCGVL